eukprot:3017662-Lingulodinium_polyedra.AAC.1
MATELLRHAFRHAFQLARRRAFRDSRTPYVNDHVVADARSALIATRAHQRNAMPQIDRFLCERTCN